MILEKGYHCEIYSWLPSELGQDESLEKYGSTSIILSELASVHELNKIFSTLFTESHGYSYNAIHKEELIVICNNLCTTVELKKYFENDVNLLATSLGVGYYKNIGVFKGMYVFYVPINSEFEDIVL